jgi:hypothetical protein
MMKQMKYLSPTFWVLAACITILVVLLTEFASATSGLYQFLPRALLIGLLCCGAAWSARRGFNFTWQAIWFVALARIGCFAFPFDDLPVVQLWFTSLLAMFLAICGSITLLQRWRQNRHEVLTKRSLLMEPQGEVLNHHRYHNQVHRLSRQLSMGNLISFTTAASIVIAVFSWADCEFNACWLIWLLFTTSGLLIGANAFCAFYFSSETAITSLIFTCAIAAGLMNLIGMNRSEWIIASCGLVVMQTTVTCAIMAWPETLAKVSAIAIWFRQKLAGARIV